MSKLIKIENRVMSKIAKKRITVAKAAPPVLTCSLCALHSLTPDTAIIAGCISERDESGTNPPDSTWAPQQFTANVQK
jgi:hypothetical protein